MNKKTSGFVWIILFAFSIIISACSSGDLHKEFLKNLLEDVKKDGDPFSSLIVSLAFNDKEKFLLVGRESGNIDIWDAKQAKSKLVIKAHEHRVNRILFTSDGNGFFSSSDSDQTTKLWNAKTGQLLHSISGARGPVCETSNSNFYLIANSSEFRIFDHGSKQMLPNKYPVSGSITVMTRDFASGQVALGTASGTIEIWEFSTTASVPTLKRILNAKPYSTGDWVEALYFSPDRKSLFSVSRSGLIDEWASNTLEKKQSISSSLKHIHSAKFLRGKEFVALGGTFEERGVGRGFVELVDLSNGKSSTNPANTSLPMVEFIAPLNSLMAAQRRLIEVYDLPRK